MGGAVPLGDASRRPACVPLVTALIIIVNVLVFVLELMRGESFVMCSGQRYPPKLSLAIAGLPS